jgi:predicted nucleic acid-binding protein
MTSIDANILLYSYCEAVADHAAARAFLASLTPRDDVALSELTSLRFTSTYATPRCLMHRSRQRKRLPSSKATVSIRAGASSVSLLAAGRFTRRSGWLLPTATSRAAGFTIFARLFACEASA